MAEKWDASNIPDQSGRTALVTGANSGIGFQAARELARAGATVVLGCRNQARGAAALERIRSEMPNAEVELLELDLSDLSSVEAAAEKINARPAPIEMLINNAGVMATPKGTTADGFELQIGTNHLGHFALNGRIIGKVLAADGGRIVSIASNAHKLGRINFDDLMMTGRRYSAWGQYNNSKLANMLYAFELDRRLRQAGVEAKSVGAHPGFSVTNLGFGVRAGPFELLKKPLVQIANIPGQSDEMGALPTLFAAVEQGVEGGDYVGPSGFGEFRGHPQKVSPAGRALKADDWRRLWAISEQLTGVRFEGLPA